MMLKKIHITLKAGQPLIKQFVKFCIVGLTNTVVDFTVYIFLTRILHWQYMVAATCSFVMAVTWSFYFNRRWTFRHRQSDIRRQYIRFVIANCISLVFNLSLLYVIVDVFNVYDLVAKLLAGVIVAGFNFSINRFWTFKS